MQAITDTLSSLITKGDVKRLRAIQTPEDYLNAVVSIYEQKVEAYLEGCEWMGASTAEAVDVAMQAFFRLDAMPLFPAIQVIVKKDFPDDYKVFGLNGLKSAFIAYVARYRLFEAVDTDALGAVCADAGPNNAFPAYLFHALNCQKLYSRHIGNRALDDRTPMIAGLFQEDREHLPNSICGLLFFMRRQVDANTPLDDRRNRIAAKVCEKMRDPEMVKALMQKVTQALSEKMSQACFAALTHLDISVKTDTEYWTRQIEGIDQALSTLQIDGGRYEQALRQAIDQTKQQIDAAPVQYPKREFVVYVGTAFRL